MQKNQNETGYAGSWWRYPPLRNALLAGLIAGLGFVLAYFGFIAERVENIFYWIREEVEKLIEKREIGIEMLMIAATAGSGRFRPPAGSPCPRPLTVTRLSAQYERPHFATH